jgi:Rad3-related DNA helicase
MIPNGILVFMPSYGCLDRLLIAWENKIMPLIGKEKAIFEEPRSGKADFESLMKRYNRAASNEKGAILFCVQRGKVSL